MHRCWGERSISCSVRGLDEGRVVCHEPLEPTVWSGCRYEKIRASMEALEHEVLNLDCEMSGLGRLVERGLLKIADRNRERQWEYAGSETIPEEDGRY